METHSFQIKVKTIEESGQFTGYGSVYDVLDLTGDIVAKGAFNQAIASQGKGYPLLWNHDQGEPIGIARIEDSATALVVHGEIDRSDPAGGRAYNRLKKGIVKGLSIGYTIPKGEGKVSYQDGARVLREVFLHELSLCAIPANPAARVTSVKSLSDVRLLLTELDTDSLESETLADLRQIATELKRLLPEAASGSNAEAILGALRTFTADLRLQ